MTFSPSDIFQTGHKFFAGVIRRTSNTTWGILDTSDGHDDINLLAVTVSSSNQKVRISNVMTDWRVSPKI